MKNEHQGTVGRRTRRDFLKSAGQTVAVVAGVDLLVPVAYTRAASAKVAIICYPSDDLGKQPPVIWAIGQLQYRLKARGIASQRCASPDQAGAEAVCVLATSHTSRWARGILAAAGLSVPDVAEATGLVRGTLSGRSVLLATGADVRGLVYAILELADRVEHSPNPIAELQRPDRIVEQPANRIRSIGRLFTSELEDKAWFYDKEFWKEYLSMLIEHRINRFAMTLGVGYNSPRRITDSYFYFAYPFLLDVPGYNVKAVGLPDAERDRNL